MKSFKIKASLLTILFVGSLFAGCDLLDQEDRTFDDTQLGFASFSQTIAEPASGGASVKFSKTVQLIGSQRSSDLSVTIAADDSSTAVAGTHYNFSSPVTIASETSSSELVVNVLDSPLADGESKVLYLSIQESDGIKPAKNFRTLTVTIKGTN
jgi:hypothetical protein